MPITTKKGDAGMTSLIGGQRVKKYDDRVEAYGTLDELSAFIGVLHDTLSESENNIKKYLMEVQKHLLTIGAVMACPKEDIMPRLNPDIVLQIEGMISSMESKLPKLNGFVLAGGNLASSYCHVCRTICRRAERAAVKIDINGPELQYLNRLSDYFFLLALKLK